MSVRLFALVLLSALATGAAHAAAGLRIRNAATVRVVVESRIAGQAVVCEDGTAYRTYRLEPGHIWVIPAQGGNQVCWRWRIAAAQVWSAWDRVDPAGNVARDIAGAP